MGFLANLVRNLFVRREPGPRIHEISQIPNVSPRAVVEEINRIRALHSLNPLEEDLKLDLTAQSWANSIAARNTLSHGNFLQRIAHAYPNATVSENVAAGQTNALQTVDDWMKDRPHREALLGNYNKIGVGTARSIQGTLYWVADFVLVNQA